ncbi:hypothetical protein E4T56_gene19705, partial [Termitomyces sp. T112]
LSTDAGRALADRMVSVQAQIIAFAHDYQVIMVFILCTIPLALMIGSTKAALRKQSPGPEHAVLRRIAARCTAPGTREPLQQLLAAEIVDRHHHPLQIVPPDARRDVDGPLPDRLGDEPEHRPAIVLVERAAAVAGDAAGRQLRVV